MANVESKEWVDGDGAAHHWRREQWRELPREEQLAREWGTVYGERTTHDIKQHGMGTGQQQVKEQLVGVQQTPRAMKVRWTTTLKQVVFGPPGSDAAGPDGKVTVYETWANEHEFGNDRSWTPHLQPAPTWDPPATPPPTRHALPAIAPASYHPPPPPPSPPPPQSLLLHSPTPASRLPRPRDHDTRHHAHQHRPSKASSILERVDALPGNVDDSDADDTYEDISVIDVDAEDEDAMEIELERQLRELRQQRSQRSSHTSAGRAGRSGSSVRAGPNARTGAGARTGAAPPKGGGSAGRRSTGRAGGGGGNGSW